MDNNGKRDISKKSDFLLKLCVENPENYSTESVEEAIAELQRRGRVFTEKELEIMRRPRPPEDNIYTGVPVIHPGWKSRGWLYNVVKNVDAPVFYSQLAISIFSGLFGVVFGAVMLGINVRKAGHKQQGLWIIVFGIIYTLIPLWMLTNIDPNISYTYLFNAIGILGLDFCWHRYIGYNTLYRAKSIWKPLIIAFAIYIPIMLLIIYGD